MARTAAKAQKPNNCDCSRRHSLRAVLVDQTEHAIEVCPVCHRIYGLPRLLNKAITLGPDEHWITLKPHGPEADDYVHVVIREHPDGTASIVRSPGGKLNYLRLTQLKKPGDWKKAAKERAKQKKAKEQARQAAMTPEQQQAERQRQRAIQQKRTALQEQFVKDALGVMGQNPDNYFTPDSQIADMPELVRDRFKEAEVKLAARKLDRLIGNMRDDMGSALSVIQTHDLGETPLDILIPPAPLGGSRMGYQACLAERAKHEGLTVDELDAEQKDIKRRHYEQKAIEQLEGMGDADPEQIKAVADDLEDRARQLHEAMSRSREAMAEALESGAVGQGSVGNIGTPDMDQVVKLLELRHKNKAKLAELSKIDREQQTPEVRGDGSFVVADSVDVADIDKELNARLKSIDPKRAIEDEYRLDHQHQAAREFLGALDQEEQERTTLRGHEGVGRYDCLNLLWLNSTGEPMPFSRAAVDILGSEGAAQLVAHNLRERLPKDDFEAAHRGLVHWHDRTQADRANQAMEDYNKLMDEYNATDVPQASDPDTLLAATLALDKRAGLLEKARELLGTTSGQLEASAELIKQMEYPDGPKELHCPLGRMSAEQAVEAARSLGLQKEDYHLDRRDQQMFLTVKPDGVDRLAQPLDPRQLDRMKTIDAIKRGDHDVKGWLPQGIVSRARSTFDDPKDRLNRIAVAPDWSGGTEAGLKGVVGKRLVQGEDPMSIRADLHSQEFLEAHVPPSERPAYFAALDRMGMGTGTSDSVASEKDLRAMCDYWAMEQLRQDGTPNLSLNSQSLDPDSAYEGIFRALAEQADKPTWLFTAPSELRPNDRKALRQLCATQHPNQTWDSFVAAHSSMEDAYAEVQEHALGEFVQRFADHYGRVTGRTLPVQLKQMDTNPGEIRTTMGTRAEGQLSSLFGCVAQSLSGSNQPVKIPQGISMSEGPYVDQQRMIRLLLSQHRMGNSFGVGSGKSVVAIGAFTEGHAQGKVKRAIFPVPSSVQAQFGSEMARYTTPGKYKWHARPGATKEERHASYADPDTHICVVTHEALRDDITEAVADDRFGGDTARAQQFIANATRDERKAVVDQAMRAKGWNFDMAVVDEGHKLLNRKGKQNSAMANVIDAMTDNTPYYMPMSADPVKNDVSEIHDYLSKLDPERYQDPEAFGNKYAINTEASRNSLRRELGLYQYSERIKPPVTANRQTIAVPMGAAQQAEYARVTDALDRLSQARKTGTVDVEAAKVVAPEHFRGQPPAEHERIAQNIQQNAGLLKNTAYDRVVLHPHPSDNAKLSKIVEMVLSKRDGTGKHLPGLVFANRKKQVGQIANALRENGVSVETFTGALSGKERRQLQDSFQSGKGPSVLVLTDAGAEGVQLERGAYCINGNIPDTAKTKEQRIGRIERLGQQNPSIDVYDVITDTPYEHDRVAKINRKKGLRDIITSPTESIDDSGMSHAIWEARRGAFEDDLVGSGVNR